MYNLQPTVAMYLLALIMPPNIAVKRDIIRTGTTVAENFFRREGTLSVPCPTSHPYACDRGHVCCQRYMHFDNVENLLDHFDPAEKCLPVEQTPCVFTYCKDAHPHVHVECPETHAFALNNGLTCCAQYARLSNPGKDIRFEDSIEECLHMSRLDCPGLPLNRCETKPDSKELSCESPHFWAFETGCCRSPLKRFEQNGICDGSEILPSDDGQCCEDKELVDRCVTKERVCITGIAEFEECPDTNPYAFNNGLSCCSQISKSSNSKQALDQLDDISECESANTIACPVSKPCSRNSNVPEFVECPLSHAWALDDGLHCCAQYARKSDPSVDITFIDPISECNTFIECPAWPTQKCMSANTPKAKSCPEPDFWAFIGGCCNSPLKTDACGGTEILATDFNTCCPVPAIDSQCDKGERLCIDTAHTSCPVSHPYAFANGTQCCSQHWVDGDTQSFILYNSSSSACPSSNSESCASPPCGRNPAGPTYGLWADWGAWAGCTKTCGGGTWIRTRTCTPSPFGGPNTCQSDPQESGPCNQQACPVNGGWAAWSGYGSCSLTCGTGSRYRTRSCTNPSPAHGGVNCPGSDTEFDSCNTQACPAWRADLRCGGSYTAPNGGVAQCNPAGTHPCCSPNNWCGNTWNHCSCAGCVDYRNKK